MIPWILTGTLSVAVVVLAAKQAKRTELDRTEAKNYEIELEKLRAQSNDLKNDICAQTSLIEEYQNKILNVQAKYREELDKKTNDLDTYFANQKMVRQSELDSEFERLERERKENLNLRILRLTEATEEEIAKIEAASAKKIDQLRKQQEDMAHETLIQEGRFEALLEPLKQYEKDQQQRLFYTIQVPEEYKGDIGFLLTTVSMKVQHPEIINKLIWSEYVKPYIDDTFKRVGIKDEPGIYKLTSLINGKCYIGKSTNIKKRISDHMKSVVGISAIADQAVHHVIAREGYWNWTIEPIIYCEKDKLNELEKYYIDFFKSNEFGYNKSKGGEG